MVPVFYGRVLPGGLYVRDRPKDYSRYIKSLAGQFVEETIRKRRTKRSNQQNAYIHAVPIPMLAEHFGYTIPEMKLVLMGECWGWKEVLGRQIPVRSHTSEMSVEECQYFVDWVIPWAVQNHDVQIPLPNEVA